jgi:outer membrane murein-binding lipoprotein Lpp
MADWKLDRQVSLAVIVAVVLQAGGALLWAGQAAARIDELESRVEAQGPLAERMARLEEQASAARAALDRIERKLG